MNKYVFVVITLSFVSNFAFANEVEKTYQFVEVSKGLEWLSKNATRIASVTVEKVYKDEATGAEVQVQSEIMAPLSAEECQNSDVDDKYTNFFLHVSEETVDVKKAGLSRWFDGKKLNGPIVKQIVVYCFAN